MIIVEILVSFVVGALVMSWVMKGPLDDYLTDREIEEVLATNLDEQEG